MHTDTATILDEHEDAVRSGLSVLVVRRYDSPARYNVTVLNDQDELGFDQCVNLGAVNSTVEGELMEFFQSLNMQHYDWEQLPRELQKFIRSHHLPIEWGGKDDGYMLGRVWTLSRRPPRAPKQRTEEEIRKAVVHLDSDEIAHKIAEMAVTVQELQHRVIAKEFARMVAGPMLDKVEGDVRELREMIDREL